MDDYKRRRRRSRAVMSMFLDSLGGSIDNVDVATFDSDGTDLKALVVGIEPIQDLHGYDNPWPAGGGKNLYDATVFPTTSKNGVTCTNNGDGSFTVNGTATGDTYFGIFDAMFADDNLPSATYRLTGGVAGGGESTYQLYVRPSYSADNNGQGITFTNQVVGGSIFVKSGCTCNNLVFRPMLRLASNGDDTFAPYANICPITGHSSVNVIVSPTLNPLDGTITNIPLGGTCYGGQLDVLPGVLMDTNANIASYNGETINEPWISSMDAYSPGATPTIGAQVVYPLSTPQIIQLTGQQIATFLGTNNVWCDSGKIIHLEY